MDPKQQVYPGYQPVMMGQPVAPYPAQTMGQTVPPYPTQPMAQPVSPYAAMGPVAYPAQPLNVSDNQQPFPLTQSANPYQSIGFMPQPVPPVHPQMFPNIPPQTADDFGEAPKDLTTDWKGFSNKAIRSVFIRKVYAILMIQLAVSFAVICLFVFEENTKMFVKRHLWAYTLAYFIFLGVYISLICCGNLRRQFPHNVILLSIFTLSMSYMLGVISSFHDIKAVMLAVGVCAAVCLLVSLFSFHSKFDFTTWGGALFVLCWVLFFFGIIAILMRNEIMTAVYAGLGTVLFVAFLAYDTQMIVGGKKHELSAEEHIFASICLYLDIVYIFMFLLMAFGKK